MPHLTLPDGTHLAYQDQGTGLPLLALSGLTRTMADFDDLAPFLLGPPLATNAPLSGGMRWAGDTPIRLIRMDYRGRGNSSWTGAATYTVLQEAADAIALLDHLQINSAAVLGTSRGGLIGMILAATAKSRLLGLCLNDVGPVLEPAGLSRIFDYLGRNPAARTYETLAAAMPGFNPGFANVAPARWLTEAQRHYHKTEDGLRITYDPALRDAFVAAMSGPSADLWPLFDACAGLPLALIRGANSDLLSPATVAKMQDRNPDMLFATVPDRAHIPFLDEAESLDLIAAWLGRCARSA